VFNVVGNGTKSEQRAAITVLIVLSLTLKGGGGGATCNVDMTACDIVSANSTRSLAHSPKYGEL
jgi:hypothetical protein